MKPNKMAIGIIGIAMLAIVLGSTIQPALAAKVMAVGIFADKSRYSVQETVRLTVAAKYDTSGLVGFAACIRYKIIIKEVKWLGLYKKEIVQRTYEGSCYVGRLPNPINIQQTLDIHASRFGNGNHKIYAEVWFASAMVFGVVTSWEKGTSRTIEITVR